MASSAIEKVIGGYDKLKTQVKNAKIQEHIEKQNMLAMGGAVVGAIAAGAVDAKYNSKKATVGLVIAGGVLGIGGVTDYIPGGLVVGMTGVGILCYVAGKASHDKMVEHLQSAT